VASPSFMGQPFEGYGLTGEEVHALSEKGPDGKEFQSMELIYSRKK